MPGVEFWSPIWVKVERSKEHLRDLEARVSEFMYRKPYAAVVYRDEDSGHHVISARAAEQPPIWWGAIAGDLVHNLRSALDLTVYQLALAAGGTPGAHTGFPIADTPADYEALKASVLVGLGESAIGAIDRVRPYRKGNFNLWRLNRLAAASQQVGLRPVAAAAKSLIDVVSSLDFPNTPIAISAGYPFKAVYPIENGTELARVFRAHASAQLDVNARDAFYVAFGAPDIVQGEPLLPTLRALVRATENTIQPLIRPLIAD